MPRPTPRKSFMPLMLIFPLVILSLSCRVHDDRPGSGSSGLIKDPIVDTTGNWEGTWDTTSGFPLDAGTVEMTIVQDEEGFLSGTSDWEWSGGDNCWSTSNMKNGRINDNEVSGLTIVELLPNVDGQGSVIVRADFTVISDVTGDVMIGTFRVSSFVDSDSRCTPAISRVDNEGVISLRRVP